MNPRREHRASPRRRPLPLVAVRRWSAVTVLVAVVMSLAPALPASAAVQPTVTISTSTTRVGEGALARFTVSAWPVPHDDLDVLLAVDSGTTADLGDDVDALPEHVTIVGTARGGLGTASIALRNNADAEIEDHELLTIRVLEADDYLVGRSSSSTVTLLDDDAPTASLAITEEEMDEGDEAVVTLSVSPAPAEDIVVGIGAYAGSSAELGRDYELPSDVVTVVGTRNGGDGGAEVTLTALDDEDLENDELIWVDVIDVSLAYNVAERSWAQIVLRDGDSPRVTIAAAEAEITEGGRTVVGVELDPPPENNTEVTVWVQPASSALEIADFVGVPYPVFVRGAKRGGDGTARFELVAKRDDIEELPELVQLAVVDVSLDYNLGETTAVSVMIVDEVPEPVEPPLDEPDGDAGPDTPDTPAEPGPADEPATDDTVPQPPSDDAATDDVPTDDVPTDDAPAAGTPDEGPPSSASDVIVDTLESLFPWL